MITWLFLAFGLAASLLPGAQAAENPALRVKVLYVPAIQTLTSGEPADKDGTIVGRTVGGEVTASFPDGIVLIRMPEGDFSDQALQEKIRATVSFDCTQHLKRGVGIKLLGEHELSPGDMIDYQPTNRVGKFHRYRLLMMNPIPGNSSLLSIRFGAGHAEGAEPLAPLLDLTLGVPVSGTLLVGFPDHSSGRRGSVYFLAIRRVESPGLG